MDLVTVALLDSILLELHLTSPINHRLYGSSVNKDTIGLMIGMINRTDAKQNRIKLFFHDVNWVTMNKLLDNNEKNGKYV